MSKILAAVKHKITPKIEEVSAELTVQAPEPVQLVMPEENPIIKMAIAQAEYNRMRDLYHGFK